MHLCPRIQIFFLKGCNAGSSLQCYLKSRAVSTELCKNGLSFPADLGETPWEMCFWAEHLQSSPLLIPPTCQPFCTVLVHPHKTRKVGRIRQVPFPKVERRVRNGGERIPIYTPQAQVPCFPSRETGVLVCVENSKAGPSVVTAGLGSSSCWKGRRGLRTPDLVPSRQTCSGESKCPGLETQTPPPDRIPEITPVPKESSSARGMPWGKDFRKSKDIDLEAQGPEGSGKSLPVSSLPGSPSQGPAVLSAMWALIQGCLHRWL